MTTKETLYELIAEQMDRKVEDLGDEMLLRGNELAIDSLDCVELVMEVEDWFDIAIPDEDAERWRTPVDIAAYVAQRLAKREEQEQE